VTLEDDEADTPDPEAAVVSVSVDAGADTHSQLSNGPWWDVEDEYYIDDDLRLIPLLQQEGLASVPTPAQGQPHSHHYHSGSSQDQINKHGNDGITGGAADGLTSHSPRTLLDENSGAGSDESASELGKDI
jgi:hypothetical protein